MNPSILSPKPSVKWEERKNKREKIKTKIEDIYIYIKYVNRRSYIRIFLSQIVVTKYY